MYPDPRQHLSSETEDAVRFFTPPFYPLDNYSAHTVEIWGRVFYTAEHAFQWKKFADTEPSLAERIRAAGSPEQAARLSRTSANLHRDWAGIKVEVMTEIIKAKVLQHEDMRQMLLSTGQKQIIENSPVDSFWGAGPDGTGQNWMGKILMRVRDELASGAAG